MTYSVSVFYAEQEYVLFKLNRLCLGSQNRVLWKTNEKTGFSETESFSGFSDPRQHLKVLNQIFVIIVICCIQ